MNLLARQDLARAHNIIEVLSNPDWKQTSQDETNYFLAEAIGRLINVCAELDKDLSAHTNTQDAHNT